MFLEKIILEGFLSYRKRQEINLTNVSTCLVLGRINDDSELSNGAGKSSLFEAISVNFFGKGSGRADVLDRYINDFMSKFYTEVVFVIDGKRYKSVRSKTKNSSGVFEVFFDSTNETLEKATWKKTDKTIEEILGLSSKTFSSTIYLNEREALQIITGTSSERKEILRDLLDIEIYEKSSKVSNKFFDDVDRKVQVNLNMIEDRQNQLEQEETTKNEMSNENFSLASIKNLLQEKEEELKQKNEDKQKITVLLETENLIKSQIEQNNNELSEFEHRIKRIDFEIEDLSKERENQIAAYKTRKQAIEDSIKEKDSIEKLILQQENILLGLNEIDKKLKEKLIEKKSIEADKVKLERSIDVLKSEQKTINDELESSKKELEDQTNIYKKRKQVIDNSIKQKPEIESAIEKQEKILLEINEADKKLKEKQTEKKSVEEEKVSLEKSIDIFKSEQKPVNIILDKLDNFKSLCPVTDLECSLLKGDFGSNLKDEKKKELKSLQEKIETSSVSLNEKIIKLREIEKEEHELEIKVNNRQVENDKLYKAKLSLQTINNEELAFKEKENEFNEYVLETKKEEEKFIDDEKVLRKKIEESSVVLNETMSKLREIEKEEHELEIKTNSRQKENDKLSNAKLSLQTIINNEVTFKEKEIQFNEYILETKKEEEEFVNERKSIEAKIITKKENISKLKAKVDDSLQIKIKDIEFSVKTLNDTIKNFHDSIEQSNLKIGKLKNKLDEFAKMKNEIESFLKANQENAKQKKIFQTLSSVFGKDGMQKSIMKDSIPMLEKFTSEYLNIFTEDANKIKVKFDLDPKKQDGDAKKGGGLDILVLEDGKDPKDLQMYSGGETVRIVFSIVLSLAKLLSQRAGKKHEALIIDEKIAKLDVRGVAQFGEIIADLSKIYKQVFIITHLEQFKDLLNGNEIIVNKTEEDGSIVTVS